MLEIDNCRSYATEKNLEAALEKMNLMELKPIVVRNREGRWTAVFRFGVVKQDAFHVANQGFMVLG